MSSDAFAIRTPDEFFERVLLPNYREFEAHPGDLRRVMNLAISCLSMRDWMLGAFKEADPDRVYGASEKGQYRKLLEDKEPLFAEVCAIANASKHLELDRKPRKGFRATDVQVGFLRMGDPVGLPLRPVKTRLADGRRESVNWMLGRVVALWASELGRTVEGVGERPAPSPPPEVPQTTDLG